MASASFRDSLGSLGWSRREADIPVNTSQQRGLLSSIKSLNPFGNSGYVQLPTTEGPGAALPAPTRREEEEGWFVCESTPILSGSVSRLPICCFAAFVLRTPAEKIRTAGHVPLLRLRVLVTRLQNIWEGGGGGRHSGFFLLVKSTSTWGVLVTTARLTRTR